MNPGHSAGWYDWYGAISTICSTGDAFKHRPSRRRGQHYRSTDASGETAFFTGAGYDFTAGEAAILRRRWSASAGRYCIAPDYFLIIDD